MPLRDLQLPLPHDCEADVDWVKLTTNYYLDAAIMRAGEAAEVLFTRAMAYCGDQETGGLVPREVLARLTPTRGAARARALVAEGLWEVVPEGWRFTNWDRHQTSRDQLATQRESARTRQARHRQSKRGRHAVTDAVSHARVTPTEVEEEVEPAAAAAGGAAAAASLPGPIDILRAKLQAHTPLRGLRFDTLDHEQTTRVLTLIDLHGDDPLVRVAVDTCRNPPPVHAGAFLGTWEALPAPGTRHLGVVRPSRCDTHGTTLSPSGACSSCAADQKAGSA